MHDRQLHMSDVQAKSSGCLLLPHQQHAVPLDFGWYRCRYIHDFLPSTTHKSAERGSEDIFEFLPVPRRPPRCVVSLHAGCRQQHAAKRRHHITRSSYDPPDPSGRRQTVSHWKTPSSNRFLSRYTSRMESYDLDGPNRIRFHGDELPCHLFALSRIQTEYTTRQHPTIRLAGSLWRSLPRSRRHLPSESRINPVRPLVDACRTPRRSQQCLYPSSKRSPFPTTFTSFSP